VSPLPSFATYNIALESKAIPKGPFKPLAKRARSLVAETEKVARIRIKPRPRTAALRNDRREDMEILLYQVVLMKPGDWKRKINVKIG
jgi:hypothetical protein